MPARAPAQGTYQPASFTPSGAVSVTGIKGDLPAWRMNELGQTMRRYADRVSEILGGARYSDRARAIEARP